MDRRVIFHVEGHPLLAALDQHRLALDQTRKFSRSSCNFIGVCHRPVHGGGQFLEVGREQCRPAVDAVIVEFRIDNDRRAAPTCRVDDGADDPLGQHALHIVGQHHRADLRQRRLGIGDDRGLALGARRLDVLPVGPQQVR